MQCEIHYSCVSHKGKCREENQDNFICNGVFQKPGDDKADIVAFPLSGTVKNGSPVAFGVFDGLGGEACGEIASRIAAETASEMLWGDDIRVSLQGFCQSANSRICGFSSDNCVGSMGTTAALLVFAPSEIYLCNIGDTKVFRFSEHNLEQISVDHLAMAIYGKKPPLSQNLGIPPDEMLIDPYITKGLYSNGDIYLICSDGLTDMIEEEKIRSVLETEEIESASAILLNAAMEEGGKDNITLILLKVVRSRQTIRGFLKSIQRREK